MTKKYFPTATAGISLLVVAVIATVWVAGRHHQYTLKNLPAGDAAAIATSQGSTLDFTQIGVELSLNSSISDAVYAPFAVSASGNQAYGISALSLMNASSDPGCQPAAGPLGIIVKTSSAPKSLTGPGMVTQIAPDNKTLFEIDGSYYQYTPPQNDACLGGSASTTTVEADQSALAQSFTSLQSDGATFTTTSTTKN